MNMNNLIYKITEMFKEDDLVTIYTSDNKIDLYARFFSNIELRQIWRLIQQEKITIKIYGNANKKAQISLSIDEEE